MKPILYVMYVGKLVSYSVYKYPLIPIQIIKKKIYNQRTTLLTKILMTKKENTMYVCIFQNINYGGGGGGGGQEEMETIPSRLV